MTQATCIVQARMGSARCPGKSMELVGGVPVVEVVLRRLARARNISAVILATSDLGRDDVLADHAAGCGFRVFRGAETDLVGRFLAAAAHYDAGEHIVRATGDNVFMDWTEIDRQVETGVEHGWDFVGFDNDRYPDRINDFAGEYIRYAALENVARLTDDPYDREHVSPYFYSHSDDFRVNRLQVRGELLTPIKLDLDYPEDLARLKLIGDRIDDPVAVDAAEVVRIANTLAQENLLLP